jgi:hypothetical protein
MTGAIMKTVFSNSQCAHVWAQQTQARGHSQSMSFEYGTLYSYRTPIAKFQTVKRAVSVAVGHEREVVFFTSQKYSMTTSSKHMPAAHSAALNYRAFIVPLVTANTPTLHADNLEYLLSKYRECVGILTRKINELRPYEFEHLETLARDAMEYADLFDVPCAAIQYLTDKEAIRAAREAREAKRNTPKQIAKRAKAQAKRDTADAARREAIAQAQGDALKLWRIGERNSAPHNDGAKGAYLRVSRDGSAVQTSRGATVPAKDARRAIAFVRAVMTRGINWKRNGEQCPVGHFQIDRIAANGDINAGCHFIEWQEISNLASLLGV